MTQPKKIGTTGQGSQQPVKVKSLSLQVFSELTLGASGTYNVNVDVRAFFGGKALANKEVVLRKGATTVNKSQLNGNGEGEVIDSGHLANSEQSVTYRVYLQGYTEYEKFTVVIPAIPQVPVTPKTINVLPGVINADLDAGTYSVSFQITVLDGTAAWAHKFVAIKEGIANLGRVKTDNNGQATFMVSGFLGSAPKEVNYRISLVGLNDEVEQNIGVPPINPKKVVDNDPESLILRRYHDGQGNFSLLARVIKAHGYGLSVPVDIWFRGAMYRVNTNSEGNASFSLSDPILPGENDQLIAMVSGIAEEAKVDIKVREHLNTVPAFTSGWWLKTNNGRAFLLCMAMIVAWFVAICIGTGEAVFTGKLYNDESGLSRVEQYHNYASQIANSEDSTERAYVKDSTKNAAKIKKEEARLGLNQEFKADDMSGSKPEGRIAYWGWMLIATVLVLIYSILSLREEIWAGVEEGVQKLFDKEYAKAGDPTFEKLAKMVGSYHVARRTSKAEFLPNNSPEALNNNAQAGPSANPNPTANSGHPSVSTLFKMDLLSDAVVAIASGIFKNIFRR
jgi:hypothetical protein